MRGLDFQAAPYEDLCGCVMADIPSHMAHMWTGDKPNHAATKSLIENSMGRRIVLADCPRCNGTGIMPREGVEA